MGTSSYRPPDPSAQFRRTLESDPTLLVLAERHLSQPAKKAVGGAELVSNLEAFLSR
jgi:hypothetical protein